MIRKPGKPRTERTAGGGRRRPGLILPAVLSLLSLPAFASWISEFRIHTYIINNQTSPSLATDGTGRFFAVWVSERQDGELTGIFGRLFSSSGEAHGPEFQVNVNWEHAQEKPFIAAGHNGRYIVTWFDHNRQNIVFRLFSNEGYPLTGERIVNERSWTFKGGSSAAMDGNGGFVVVWHTHKHELGKNHVYARIFDSFGNPLGSEYRVSRDGFSDQLNPSVAMQSDGRFTVVWTRFAAHGPGSDIVGRQFSRSGLPLGNEFFIADSSSGRHDQPRLAMDSSGAFMVCWHAHTFTEEAYNILIRPYTATALPISGAIVANSGRAGWQVFPSISSGDAGYLLAWQSYSQNGTSGIFSTVVDGNGAPRIPEFRVNRTSEGRQERPAGVFLGPHRIAIVWQDFRGEASVWDVYAAIHRLSLDHQESRRPANRFRTIPMRTP